MASYYTGAAPRASGARIGAAPEDAAAAATAAAAVIAYAPGAAVLDRDVAACVIALAAMRRPTGALAAMRRPTGTLAAMRRPTGAAGTRTCAPRSRVSEITRGWRLSPFLEI
jgi:hypothetical protein